MHYKTIQITFEAPKKCSRYKMHLNCQKIALEIVFKFIKNQTLKSSRHDFLINKKNSCFNIHEYFFHLVIFKMDPHKKILVSA